MNSFKEFNSGAAADGFLIAKDYVLASIFDNLKTATLNLVKERIKAYKTFDVALFATNDGALLDGFTCEYVM